MVSGWFPGFLICSIAKNENAGNQQKAFYIRDHPLLTVNSTGKLLKSHQFVI